MRSTMGRRFDRLYGLINPTNLATRARLLLRGRRERPRIYFVAHNRNHVRLIADAALYLQAQGFPVAFAHLDGTKRGGVALPEFACRGIAAIDFAELRRDIRRGDVLVTANDFGPPAFRHFIDSINRGVVRVVGLTEGARALRPHRYQRVDHVLGFGPAAQRHFDQPITIVGSPVIERALEKVRGRRRAGRYVLVSFKANPGDLDARRALDAVSEACRQLGLPLKISVHPTKAAKLDLPGTSSADFSDLLPEALALVSRPSTTIYEAIACGIPVVLFPLVEPLVEFAEPLGAFRPTKVEDLVPNIRDAVASRENFAEQGRAFLEANLSIEPDRPAWRRLAEALIEIYERKAG